MTRRLERHAIKGRRPEVARAEVDCDASHRLYFGGTMPAPSKSRLAYVADRETKPLGSGMPGGLDRVSLLASPDTSGAMNATSDDARDCPGQRMRACHIQTLPPGRCIGFRPPSKAAPLD
jgi:hypothetical protein